MGALEFTEPSALLFLGVIPVLIALYFFHQRKKKRAALKFSSLGIVKASAKKIRIRTHLPFVLLSTVVALMVLGLAGPTVPLKTQKQGVNVVLAIDDSGSMAATDYKPTRLEAAKNAAATLIKSLKPKDNVGIVVFESGATTAAYLTPFKEKALEKLRAIQQKDGQTAIGDGLALAIDMAASIPNKRKVVILLSDGVNNAGVVSPGEAIKFAKTNSIQVYTIGLGSKKPVLLGYDFFGRPQYAELDEKTLKRIASETGGEYYRSVNNNTLNEIYSRIGQNIKREWEQTSVKDWFFAAALALLLFNIYLIYGKYRIVV